MWDFAAVIHKPARGGSAPARRVEPVGSAARVLGRRRSLGCGGRVAGCGELRRARRRARAFEAVSRRSCDELLERRRGQARRDRRQELDHRGAGPADEAVAGPEQAGVQRHRQARHAAAPRRGGTGPACRPGPPRPGRRVPSGKMMSWRPCRIASAGGRVHQAHGPGALGAVDRHHAAARQVPADQRDQQQLALQDVGEVGEHGARAPGSPGPTGAWPPTSSGPGGMFSSPRNSTRDAGDHAQQPQRRSGPRARASRITARPETSVGRPPNARSVVTA